MGQIISAELSISQATISFARPATKERTHRKLDLKNGTALTNNAPFVPYL